MSKFQEKKKLLAAESEVYRELLKLEFQTFKIYGKRAKRKWTSPGTYMPLVMSGLPMLGTLFGRKRGSSLGRMGSLLMLGWKTYQRFAPMFSRKSSLDNNIGRGRNCRRRIPFPKTLAILIHSRMHRPKAFFFLRPKNLIFIEKLDLLSTQLAYRRIRHLFGARTPWPAKKVKPSVGRTKSFG